MRGADSFVNAAPAGGDRQHRRRCALIYHVRVTAAVERTEPELAQKLNGAAPDKLTLRWVTVAEAARILGISQAAVRKRLAAHSLTGIRAGRSWKVLLAGERESPLDAALPEPTPSGGDSATVLAQTAESLNALVRDLQRQSLALAAQVGYLQSQLVDAQSQVKLLTERNDSAVDHDSAGPSRAEYDAAQETIAALRAALAEARREDPAPPPARRRWRFWRR
jgi:excisionase family DNA binding protein